MFFKTKMYNDSITYMNNVDFTQVPEINMDIAQLVEKLT